MEKKPKCPMTDEWLKTCGIYTEQKTHLEKKRWTPAICKHMDGTWGYYAKWNQKKEDKYQMI